MFRDRHFHRTGRWHSATTATDTTAPTFLDVTEETPTANTVFINWSLDEGATGYIEYGVSTDYGSETAFEDSYLTYHRQQLAGLSAGTTYYYRITSVDASGNAATYTGDVTTSGSASVTSTIYGPALAARAKGNLQVRPLSRGIVGYRFKARYGGTVDEIRSQWTNRVEPYGGGDGGLFRVGIQSVDASLMPTGTWLGDTDTYSPGIITTPANFGMVATLASGPTLTVGTYYAIVIENIHASPDSNWSSINNAWAPDATTPKQPYYPDDENVTIYGGSSSWVVSTSYMPCFDIVYSSGDHEGVAAITGRDYDYTPDRIGYVNSGSTGRWSFTYPAGSSSMDVDAVNFWMQKASGSTDATVDVHVNSASQATGTFSTSGVLAADQRAWCRAALSGTVTIDAGDLVEVFVAVTAGEYRLPLISYRDSSTTSVDHMESYPYDGGDNIHRADDGATGTTPAYAAWYAHSAYGAYFEIT